MDYKIGRITDLSSPSSLMFGKEEYEKISSGRIPPVNRFTWEQRGDYIYGESDKLYANIREVDGKISVSLFKVYSTTLVAQVYLNSVDICKMFSEYFLRNFA